MALAHTTSPIRFTGTPADNTNITSASFTPANGSRIVVFVNADSNTDPGAGGAADNGDIAVSVTSTGPVFTKQVERDIGNSSNQGHSSIWTGVGAGSAITVSAKRTTNGGGTDRISVKIEIFTDTGTPGIGVTGNGSSATNNQTASVFTSSVSGSFAGSCCTDWAQRGVFTSSDLTIDTADYAGAISIVSGYKSLGVAGAQTVNLNAGGTSAPIDNWVAIEITPNAGSSTYDNSLSDTVTIAATATGAGEFPRSTADSVTAADAATGGVDRISAASDSVTASDAAGDGVDRTSTASDATTFTDSSSAGLVATVSSTDSVTIAETASGGLVAGGAASDAVSVADSGAGTLDATRAISETLSVANSASAGFDVTNSSSDSLSVTDVGAGSVEASASAGDTAILTDAGSGGLTISASISDPVAVTDTAAGDVEVGATTGDIFRGHIFHSRAFKTFIGRGRRRAA